LPRAEGILGIGYDINEVQVNRNGKPAYPNVPQLLANDGYIQSNAYSLWLNDLVSSTGSILFGGVNTGKFHGQLQTLPVLSVYGVFAEFLITLTGLGITLNGKGSSQTLSSNSLPTAVLLDSGTTLTYLPDQVTQAIFNEVGAQYDPAAGAAYVPCSLMNNATTIDFTFSSPVISIPMKELVLYPRTNAGGSPITFKDGTPACIFGISPAGGSTAVMGDTFIRSAYVVYDIANNEISLAQTNFNSTETHILEISAGPSGVPGARRVSNPVTAVATATGGARISTPSTTASVISGSDTTIAYLPFVSVAGIACAVLLFAF